MSNKTPNRLVTLHLNHIKRMRISNKTYKLNIIIIMSRQRTKLFFLFLKRAVLMSVCQLTSDYKPSLISRKYTFYQQWPLLVILMFKIHLSKCSRRRILTRTTGYTTHAVPLLNDEKFSIQSFLMPLNAIISTVIFPTKQEDYLKATQFTMYRAEHMLHDADLHTYRPIQITPPRQFHC